MSPPRAWLASCGTCQRIREIMLKAPWLNFDLMTSVIVCGIGFYLLLMPGMFQAIGGVYSGMARLGPEWAWAVARVFAPRRAGVDDGALVRSAPVRMAFAGADGRGVMSAHVRAEQPQPLPAAAVRRDLRAAVHLGALGRPADQIP